MKRERRIKAAHNGEKGTTIKRCEEQFVKLRAMTKLWRHEKRSLYLPIVRDSRRAKAADVPVHSSLDWLNCTGAASQSRASKIGDKKKQTYDSAAFVLFHASYIEK